jgi:hypothetical protein
VTLAVIGVLVVLLAMVVFAPWFTVHDPYTGSALRRLKPIGTPGHWLGTDEVGRDLWSRMVYGGRLSLLAGVVPVFLALLIGGFLGVLAGFTGGLVNSAIMRVTDVLYAFPSILLAIAITGILGFADRPLLPVLQCGAERPQLGQLEERGVRHADRPDREVERQGADTQGHPARPRDHRRRSALGVHRPRPQSASDDQEGQGLRQRAELVPGLHERGHGVIVVGVPLFFAWPSPRAVRQPT